MAVWLKFYEVKIYCLAVVLLVKSSFVGKNEVLIVRRRFNTKRKLVSRSAGRC